MANRFIEVCCGDMAGVISARDGGARRLELCTGIALGGITPSAGLIAGAVRERGEMQVNVLIRPRQGDFCYTTRELSVMEADIETAKAAGADGVVIGALTPAGEVDIPAMRCLLAHCDGLSVTFHRAFDVVASPSDALEQIIDLGIDRLLTSGCRATALEGVDLIAKLQEQARGRIIIMPGAGITPANIAEIERRSGCSEFHSTSTDKSQPAPPDSPLFGPTHRPVSAATVHALVTV